MRLNTVRPTSATRAALICSAVASTFHWTGRSCNAVSVSIPPSSHHSLMQSAWHLQPCRDPSARER